MRTTYFVTTLFHTLVAALSVSAASFNSIPAGWTLERRADPEATIRLKFSLVQSNLHNLDAYLLDVSDPQSPNYGQHWTASQVAETFRPSKDATDTVRSWLTDDQDVNPGAVQLSRDGGTLAIDVTVAQAEEILGTEYNVYKHNSGGVERVGCHEGHKLPEHVAAHVDFVWPTRNFAAYSISRRDHFAGGLSRMSSEPLKRTLAASYNDSGTEHCDTAVTLDCLRALYNFHYDLVAADKNSVGIAEFGTNIYQPADLEMFFERFRPDQIGHQPKFLSIAGGHLNSSDFNVTELAEATLDLELVMGLLGSKQEVLLYQTGTDSLDPTLGDKFIAALDASYCDVEGVKELNLTDCGDQPVANVISISYTNLPDFPDPELLPFLLRQCAEIGKISLTGVTVVSSSGDNGVAFDGGVCSVNGTLVAGNPPGGFVSSFPASCPYVTAVGGTSVSPGHSVHDPETAVTAFPSGGGFSNVFSMPSYQKSAVEKYLEHFAPSYPPDVFNRFGRAYPDVSANGFPIVVAINGTFTLESGTSASAPIFASIITAVNDARLAVGKRPVGFINPTIYTPVFAHTFNDIRNGSNPGCGTEGFVASPGWDPVTGLGTPNFKRLLERFLALP